MKDNIPPRIGTQKIDTPAVYLDSCAIIELARYKNGKCTGEHKNEIGKFFDTISPLIKNNHVYSVLGNQLSEVAMTQNRKQARNFLFDFTNCTFSIPESIYFDQMKVGFKSYQKKDEFIKFGIDMICEDITHYKSQYKIRIAPTYSNEKAQSCRQEKIKLSNILNSIKNQHLAKETFEEQLMAELTADNYTFVKNVMKNPISTQHEFDLYLDEIERFYRITNLISFGKSKQYFKKIITEYYWFLLSTYHDSLPYIRIRANLWAHLMHRPDNITPSDNLDIQWASAYLPYIHYAVTDKKFCKTLYQSGIANLYKVKVYSISSINELTEELQQLKKRML